MNRRDLLRLSMSSLALSQGTGLFARQRAADSALQDPDPYKDLPSDAPTAAMVVYEGFTVLDLIGPYQFIWALSDHRVRIVAKQRGPVTSDTGIQIVADSTFEECPTDVSVLFVGGGTDGTLAAMKDSETREFFADRGPRAKHLVSVCTGSLILGAAGLLKGKKAASHFTALDLLPEFGAVPLPDRIVEDGNLLTGAGVSAGLDLGLAVVSKIAGEAYAKQCQLFFEYDPQPPLDSGSPAKASADDIAMCFAMVEPFREAVRQFAKEIKK